MTKQQITHSILSCMEELKASSWHKYQFCIFIGGFHLIQHSILISDVVKIQQPLLLLRFFPWFFLKNQGYGFQLAENLDMLCQTSLSLQCKNSVALEEFAVAVDGDFLSIDTGQRKTTKHNQNWNRNLENHYHHLWDWKSKMVRGRFICTRS